MKIVGKNTGIKVKAFVKAGGFGGGNHSRSGLSVRSGLKAGGGMMRGNHSSRCLP